MKDYSVQISEEVYQYLDSLDKKSRRVCRENLKKLSKPYPGEGIGDKEKIVVEGKEAYRIHIGRTYTAFYTILKDRRIVRVVELLPIDKAHKKYVY